MAFPLVSWRGGVGQVIPKYFLFFGENIVLSCLLTLFEHMECVVDATSTVRVGCLAVTSISHHVKKGKLCLHDGSDDEPGPGTYMHSVFLSTAGFGAYILFH